MTPSSAYKVYLALILTLSLANVCLAIIRGIPGDIKNAPFLVSLHRNLAFICGGVLLSKTQVITAAHCTADITRVETLMIRAGSAERGKGVTSIARRIYIHPNYDANTYADDISVVKLRNLIEGTNIGKSLPLLLPVPDGADLKVYGWGRHNISSNAYPQIFRVANMNQVADSDCIAKYSNISGVRCFKSSSYSACNGDAGGPVTYNNRVIGVITGGSECSSSPYPNVYTGLRQTYDWLNQTFYDST